MGHLRATVTTWFTLTNMNPLPLFTQPWGFYSSIPGKSSSLRVDFGERLCHPWLDWFTGRRGSITQNTSSNICLRQPEVPGGWGFSLKTAQLGLQAPDHSAAVTCTTEQTAANKSKINLDKSLFGASLSAFTPRITDNTIMWPRCSVLIFFFTVTSMISCWGLYLRFLISTETSSSPARRYN